MMLTILYTTAVAVFLYFALLDWAELAEIFPPGRFRTRLTRLTLWAWMAGAFSAMVGMLLLGGGR